MVLNSSRTKLTVNVIDNEYEARLGRIPPKEVFEVDVHNRIVDTRDAPFMPAPESKKATGSTPGLTSQPAEFPEGNWLITGMKVREDKYGPYMISTNAMGSVDVYAPDVTEGGKKYIGTYKDIGYTIHSNTIPFEYSKSYGCLIVRQEDVVRLADTLNRDRQENQRAVQTIRARPHREEP